MPLYFVHIRDGESVAIDPDGQEFASFEDVLKEVALGARDLVADALRSGNTLDFLARKTFEIRDEAGNLIREVPFKEAFDSSL